MLTEPLTEKELKQLGHFLLKDKNWMDLTQLHAFLCALISGPVLIMPSQWHPYAFGENGLAFDSQEEAEWILMLLTRLNNHVVNQMMRHIPCEPILYEQGTLIAYQADDADVLLQRWCAYLEGARFDEGWTTNAMAVAWLLPFGVLANEFSLIGEKDNHHQIITDDHRQRTHFKKTLPESILALYDFWKTQPIEANSFENTLPDEHPAVKIGRNERCPCGSGKKYKKCCLNADEIIYH